MFSFPVILYVKWLILGTYRLPNQPINYFFENVGEALDIYRQIYDKFLLCGDFNSEHTELSILESLSKYDSKNVAMGKTCSENSENPRCIDLFLTNSVQSFQNTSVFVNGISDFHKMILTILKTSFPKSGPKKIIYKNYKNYNSNSFKSDLKKQLKCTESYESFENVFLDVLQRYAPLKTKVVRANHAPYMNKTLRKAIMKMSELSESI